LDQTRMPDGGVYHGHRGVREFYSRWVRSWDFQIAPERLIDAGEQVVDINEVSGRGRGSDVQVKMRTANIWTIERGKVAARWLPERLGSLEAVGLAE
jgi:SnoaL-like domain